MTLATSNNKVSYVSSGTETLYDFDFPALSVDFIKVFIDNVEQGSGFTVTLDPSGTGGTVALSAPVFAGDSVVILRDVPLTQGIDYSPYGPFPSETHERGLDLGVARDQQLQEQLNRSLKFPIGSDINGQLDASPGELLIVEPSGAVGGIPLSDFAPGSAAQLKLDLANPIDPLKGSTLVSNGSDTVKIVLSDRSLTPNSQGAVGDGVADDTSPAQSAINFAGTEVFLRHGQKYRITTLNNQTGKPFAGDGHIVKPVTGGLEAQNTYADRHQRATGQENLAAWYRLIYDQHVSPTRRMRVVFSGDSTTAGAGIATADYWISALVQTGIVESGVMGPFGTECINNGNSGAHTGQWASTFVNDDIADAPDLLVARWGINDPAYLKSGSPAPANAGQAYPNRRDINDFATSLRSGLATFRAARPFATTSILLMMPNSTYDIPNARDALWYEQLRNVYIQAARDFRCAFIDTYAIMQDSKLLAGIIMDDPYSDGRGIHPNEVMNSVIAGHIIDLIIPQGLRYRLSTNKFFSLGGNALEVSAALGPESYDQGLYYTRTLPANGWPIDGNAITSRTADQTLIQYNFGYSNADRGKLKFRLGRATSIGGEPAGWSPFYDIAITGGATLVTPDAGYSLPAAGGMRASFTGTMACFDGYVIKTSPAVIAANTRIAGIAAGFAPSHESAYCTAIVWDGSAFEQVPAIVDVLGNIRVLKATTLSVQRVWLNVSYDRRS